LAEPARAGAGFQNGSDDSLLAYPMTLLQLIGLSHRALQRSVSLAKKRAKASSRFLSRGAGQVGTTQG